MEYDGRFFRNQLGAVRSAEHVLPLVFQAVPARRVVDVGCGIGAWASVAKTLGCTVVGMDGDWVPRNELLIARDEFVVVDLASPSPADDRFDLALCLEVAEHIPEAGAAGLVDFLCSLAPAILFSAAVPWQVGTGHVNERYPSYWAAIFEKRGYNPIDVVRPVVWADRRVEFYYRQNTILYVDPGRVTAVQGPVACPMDVIHPDAVPILAQGWLEAGGAAQAIKLTRRILKNSVLRRLGW